MNAERKMALLGNDRGREQLPEMLFDMQDYEWHSIIIEAVNYQCIASCLRGTH